MALILLFLTEPVQYLPKAVLGAVIVFAAIGLIDPQAWWALAAVDNVEIAIAGVTTGCVVVFGVLEAFVVAVGLSIIDTVRRSARPHCSRLGRPPRPVRRRVSPPLGAGDAGGRGLQARRPPLRQRALFQGARARGRPWGVGASLLGRLRRRIGHACDSTGLEALNDLAKDLHRDEITLVVAGLRTRMQEQLDLAGVTETIGRERFFPSVSAAVDAFQARRAPVRSSDRGDPHLPLRVDDVVALRHEKGARPCSQPTTRSWTSSGRCS